MKAVLFDWDGTLVDTAEASFRCYQRMFASFGISFGREDYEKTYSPNWYETFRLIGLSEEHWPAADSRWLEHFACESVSLVPGAEEALALLDGLTKAIVTSGSRPRLERELVHYDMNRHFRHLVCGTDVENKKPHPEALLRCLDHLGIAASEAAYIGDSPEDMAMARAAGVYSVAVPGGYPNRAALAAARPDVLADDLVSAARLLLVVS